MTSSILDDYNKHVEEQEETCPKFGGSHDYERLDQQFISKNIIEINLICLQCNSHKYVYNYLEDSEL